MIVDGLETFLRNNPLMRLEPIGAGASMIISGKVNLNHQYQDHPAIVEWLKLQIVIPKNYPKQPPVFREVGSAIPRSGDYHINPDGTLCLGAPFRLILTLSNNSCFNSFFETFFIPYTYAALLKFRHNIDFVFGELSHGNEGEIEDFEEHFGVGSKEVVIKCLAALALKKRIANKNPCPCNCGRRLGICRLHYRLNTFRNLIPRSHYAKIKQRLSE